MCLTISQEKVGTKTYLITTQQNQAIAIQALQTIYHTRHRINTGHNSPICIVLYVPLWPYNTTTPGPKTEGITDICWYLIYAKSAKTL